jgi:hypothetical protein
MLIALPVSAGLASFSRPVADRFTSATVLPSAALVRELPVTLSTVPADCVLLNCASFAVAPPAPCASTLRMLPVNDWARTFTAPTL